MTAIPASISDFLNSQKAATVCCLSEEGNPYCFNCYYAYLPEEGWLIYKSGFSTKHEELLKKKNTVAGTVIPEELVVATIRGVQYQGVQLVEDMRTTMKANGAYYLKYPFAMAVPGKIFVIRLDKIKFTDNAISFGHKEHWSR